MSTDMKLIKSQIFKIIQSGGSSASWLGNLGKKALTDLAFPLARDYLPGLVSILASNKISKFGRKISGKGAVEAGKGFTLSILNKDMNDIIKIINSLEDSGVLIDGVAETIKHEMKKTRRWIYWNLVLALLAASIVQPLISPVVKGVSGRRVK